MNLVHSKLPILDVEGGQRGYASRLPPNTGGRTAAGGAAGLRRYRGFRLLSIRTGALDHVYRINERRRCIPVSTALVCIRCGRHLVIC